MPLLSKKRNFKLYFVGLERRLSCYECLFLLQRTRDEFPAPSTQVPITPPPGDQTFSTGLCMNAPRFTWILKPLNKCTITWTEYAYLGQAMSSWELRDVALSRNNTLGCHSLVPIRYQLLWFSLVCRRRYSCLSHNATTWLNREPCVANKFDLFVR